MNLLKFISYTLSLCLLTIAATLSAKPVLSYAPGDSSVKTFRLSIPVYGYFRNYEYFNPIVPGYTLFGNIFSPQIIFSNDTTFSLSAGVLLQQDYGTTGYRRAEPIFKISYRYKGLTASLGQISTAYPGQPFPSELHEMPEPLYDYDNSIVNPIENGEQITWKNRYFYIDQWVDWKRMIYFDSHGQENISAGFSGNILLVNDNDTKRFQLQVPVKALFNHHGGQIGNVDSSSRVLTQVNYAAGLHAGYKINGFIKKAGITGYIMSSRSNSENPLGLPGSGLGLLGQIQFYSRYGFDVSFSYWHGEDFTAPLGSPLYQSRQSVYSGTSYYTKYRDLVFGRLTYRKIFGNYFDFNIYIEPYYDLNLDLFEYMYAISIRYNFNYDFLTFKAR